MDITLVLTVLGILVTAFIPLVGYVYKTNRELRNFYALLWKNSRSLKERDLLGERPFNDYYFERSEDHVLRRNIERRSNVLLIGPPLIGKTRAVYEQLKKLKKKVDILVPRSVAMPSFIFPKDYKFWRRKVIFIDDLQYYIEKQDNYHLLFKSAKENNIFIIATCHSGQEFKKVKNKLVEQSIDLDNLFGENIVEYEKVNSETGKQIAERLGLKWDKVKFNGTIGSIFMRLSEMERRYDLCSEIEKSILLTIRALYITGLYSDNSNFNLDWIKKAAGRHELSGKDFEWTGWLKSLEGKEFIKIIRRNKIWAEDAYLEYIVKPTIESDEIEAFEDMTEVFADDSGVLLMLAERAYDTGSVDINISEYMNIAIKACEQAMKCISPEETALKIKAGEYAGRAHWNLSKVADVIPNNRKALKYYNEALALVNRETNPFEYARLQNRIGNSYSSLATMTDNVKNCLEAINLYNEALAFFTAGAYPAEFARVNNNLGGIYMILGQLKDPLENFKKAVSHLKNALKFRTFEKHPREYGDSNNNLGNTYALLSEIEDKAVNLKLAIECYRNFQKVFTKDRYPFNYALALSNLGSTYSMLAEMEEPEANSRKAIELLEEALDIRNAEKFPIQYGAVQYNIGLAYLTLARHNNSAESCYKAIDAFEESLTIRTVERFSSHYALSQEGLGDVYIILAQIEDKSENYRKSLAAYDEALRIFTEDSNPAQYEKLVDKISRAKKIFF